MVSKVAQIGHIILIASPPILLFNAVYLAEKQQIQIL